MLNRLNIRTKLSILFVTVSLIPFLVFGVISVINSSNALSSFAFGQLKSIRELKSSQIRGFLEERQKNITILRETVAVLRQSAFDKLSIVQENKKAQIQAYFQKLHNDITVISKNASVLMAFSDFKSTLDQEGRQDKRLYQFFDRHKYGSTLSQYQKTYGYRDLLLITRAGLIVYSVKGENDLLLDLSKAPMRTSGLDRCFRGGLTRVTLVDFELYENLNNRQLAFTCAPLRKKNGRVEGVVALKFDKTELNIITQRREGMGNSGETFLLSKKGQSYFLRSDPLYKEGEFGKLVSERYISAILSKKSKKGPKIGILGFLKYTRHDNLDIPGLDWMMVTVMKLEEIIAPDRGEHSKDYFGKYVETYGYSDLYLISPSGHIFYSVLRRSDYGTNVVDGLYANTGLGKLFQRVRKSGRFEFADFAPYKPAAGRPSAFIAQPIIFNKDIELVVALRLSIDNINQMMQQRIGMGKTGETYLVGPDNLMRSDAYRDIDRYSVQASFDNPESGRFETAASQAALAGQSGEKIISGYLGREVLSAYAPLDAWGTTWAFIAEIDTAEAFSSITVIKRLVGFMALLGALVILSVSLLLARRIAGPIKRLTGVTEKMSSGTLDVEVDKELLALGDEIGILSRSYQSMTVQLRSSLADLTREISERKRLNTVIESTSDLVSMAYPDGQITYMNRAGRQMIGWMNDEPRQINEIHPEWAFELIDQTGIPEAIDKGIWIGETAVRDSENNEIPVSQVIMSHKSESGQLEHLSTIMRDISDQKRTEDEMRRLRHLLSNTIDAMPSILIGVDRYGNVQQWNWEAEKITGTSASDAQGRLLYDVFPKLEGEKDKINHALDHGKQVLNEKIMWFYGAKTRFVDITIYPLVSDVVEGAVIRVDDITERVRMEQLMVQTEKMMSIGGLAAGMAHEINNPLGAIVQGAQVIKQRLSPDKEKNQTVARKYDIDLDSMQTYMQERKVVTAIEAIQQSGIRASKIISNMLQFSRKSDSKMNSVYLDRLLEHTIELANSDYDLKKGFDFRHIEILREYPETVPPVQCIDTEIEQVILNLLRNAAQAMSEIDADSSPRITVRLFFDNNHATIEIEDNGPGIEEATQKRIFEPFFTTKPVGQGTGLGLSVSYMIITNNHQGTMEVDSAFGKGTCFKFSIPLQPQES